MSSSQAFQNNFKDNYDYVLNSSHEISDEFIYKTQSFINSKVALLHSKMMNDVFNDHTVYTGSAGLAMFYLLQAMQKQGSHTMLKMAWDFIDLSHLKGRRISFLCGDAGPLAIATVISHKMGSKRPSSIPDYNDLTRRLLSLISLSNESPDEILYGKSGYLYSLLFVNKHIRDAIPSSHIEEVVSQILKSGKSFSQKMKSDSPLLWAWHDKIYLGAAHGVAGILYMLLQAQRYMSSSELKNYVRPSLDWLLSLQFKSGNFPSSLDSSSGDRLIQWCHGAPGFVDLCILASQVFNDDRYMKIAMRAGNVVWERGLCKKGYSLCHGVGGNAYTFIQLYQATKDPVYLYRACCFTDWCVMERKGTQLHLPDRPASLFEGLVGRMYLAQDMTNLNQAKFPGFTV